MTSSVTPTVVAPYFVSAGTSDVKRSCAQQTHTSFAKLLARERDSA